jgi:hypothetical protein
MCTKQTWNKVKVVTNLYILQTSDKEGTSFKICKS